MKLGGLDGVSDNAAYYTFMEILPEKEDGYLTKLHAIVRKHIICG